MDSKLALALAKANLDCLTRNSGFNKSNIESNVETLPNGSFRVRGEIHKGSYHVDIKESGNCYMINIVALET